MSFKGDLSTIGLAEVFQMISMSQKEGTLIVQDKDSRKCIFFGGSGVKLLSTGKRKGLRVGDLLVRAGKISEEALNEALETAKIQKKLLGEVLVETGVVTDDMIQDIVRSQIEEEIYDLFLWKKADFEFVEGSPANELVDPDSRVTKLSFDVNGLLLEAVRRADEWNVINKIIPSSDSIYVFVSESDRQDEDQTAAEGPKRVFRLLDGQTSVAEIVDNTGISEFEVSKCLIDLHNRGRIRSLTVQEMMDLAAKRMAQGVKDLAIRTYQAAALTAPDDPKVAAGIAKILEGEGLDREAASHYLKAGRLYMNQGDLDRALDSMKRAGEKDPEDLEVKTGIFEVYAAAGNLDEGKRLARELVNQAMMLADNNRARALCDRLLTADPADLDFRISRARVLHRMNLKAELEKDLDYIKKNLPVDPKENEKIQRALQEVLGRPLGAGSGPQPRAVQVATPSRPGSRKWVAIAVVILVMAGVAAAGKLEMDARKELDRVRKGTREKADARDYESAQKIVGTFLQSRHALSPWQKEKAEVLAREIGEERRTYDEEQRKRREQNRQQQLERMREMAASIADAERQRNPLAAMERARELLRTAQEAADAEYRSKAEAAIARLQAHFDAAKAARSEAESFEKQGLFKEAAQAIDRLLSEYPNTEAAQGALYPLAITTVPSGVKVTNLRTNHYVGETLATGPLVYRLRPGEGVRLRFEKEGYGREERDVPTKLEGRVHAELDVKLGAWIVPGLPMAGEPLAGDEAVYAAINDRIVALRATDGRLLWRGDALEGGRIVGSLRQSGNRIFGVTMEGWVHAVEPRKDGVTPVWKMRLPDGRGQGSPTVSPDGKILYAGATGRAIHLLDAKTGTPIGKSDLPGDVTGDPVLLGETLVAACDEGSLVGVTRTGKVVWRVSAERPIGPLCASDGSVYFVAGERLYAVTGEGTVAWKAALSGGGVGRPARVGGTVFAASRDGQVHAVSASRGISEGAYAVARGSVDGGVTAAGALLLLGSDDQYIYAFDAERRVPRWKCRGNGKFRTPCTVGNGRAYFVSDDVVYAIELN